MSHIFTLIERGFSKALNFGKVLPLIFALSGSAQSYFDTTTHYLTVRTYGNTSVQYDHKDYRLILDSVRVDSEYYSMREIIMGNKVVTNHLKVSKKKVYILCENNGVKKFVLLYDFNLKDGESTLVNGLGLDHLDASSQIDIDSVRPIQLNNKTFIAHYSRVQGIGRLVMIEHIGGLENGILFFEAWGFESESNLVSLCRKDSLLVYHDHVVVKSGKNTCNPVFFSAGIEDVITQDMINIYPNPGNQFLTISTKSIDALTYEIIDIKGQSLMKGSFDNVTTIDISRLPAGLYSVSILSSTGSVKKMLILE